MSNCLFCKIIEGEIPAEKLVTTEDVVAFRDINPQAPDHVLIVPRKHIEKLSDVTSADRGLVGTLICQARQIAHDLGLDKSGYRLVINNGETAGQSVWQLHVHLLGGRDFQWPPG